MTFRSLHRSDWIVKRLMMMISVKRAKFLNPHDIHWTGRLELYLVLLPYLVFYNKFSLISFLPFSRLPTLSFTKYKQKQRKPVSCVHRYWYRFQFWKPIDACSIMKQHTKTVFLVTNSFCHGFLTYWSH